MDSPSSTTIEVFPSRKKTLFYLLSSYTDNPDVLQLIYSFMIDAETEDSRNYHTNSLFARELRLNINYDDSYFNDTLFQSRLPDERGIEWAIKNSDKLSHDVSRGNTLDIIQIIGTRGLFITRMKDPKTDILTSHEVMSVHRKIHYINIEVNNYGWDELCDDLFTFLQTGIPIEIIPIEIPYESSIQTV